MASTAARPLGESATTGSIFSYAQAAKGQKSSTTTSIAQSSQGPSGANTPKETAVTANTLTNGTSNSNLDRHNSVDSKKTSSKPESGDNDDISKLSSSAIAKSLPSSPTYGSTSVSTLPKDDENSTIANLISDSPWDKLAASEGLEKPSDFPERKKGRKGKKDKAVDKDAEKDKEEVKQEIFVPAPPPAVNFWLQRKEAAAAKVVKPSSEAVEPSQTAEISSINDTTMGAKSAEFKKKVKSVNLEEGDKPSAMPQNGIVKDQSNSGKGPKKGTDTANKAKEDPNTKRASRGSRLGDKEEKSLTTQAPPPVEDAISWPTPESALEEEKRKAQEKVFQEKEEKDDASSNKPRQKKEWKPVAYIPTVTFNTPLPARGRGRGIGRGGREGGGRGGHAPSGSVSGDKAANSTANSSAESRERGRETSGSARATSLPPNASKRSGGDASFNTRDQRKGSTTSTFEKPRNEIAGSTGRSDQSSGGHGRRMSTATQGESGNTVHSEVRPHSLDTGRFNKYDQPNGAPGDQADVRSIAPERRSDGNIRLGDFSKESNGNSQSRERGDNRGDRGRGGYRGRGGNNNFQNGQQHAQQPFVNGHASHPSNGYGIRQNSGPYSPPLQQSQYPTPFPPQPVRGGARNGPARAQSIPNGNQMYARFPPAVSGQPQMAPIQTGGAMFDYSGMQTMSAAPFNPYIEQYSMLAMVTMQLEYYFSIDNLCKDVYLRKHMDGQGFVFLKFIAGFKRIQQLTQDLDLLRFACQESEVIDIVIGDDGVDRVRRNDGWEKWVLGTEERDESVRNSGPQQIYRQVPFQRAQQMASRMMVPGQPVMSPPAFSPNGSEQGLRPYGPGPMMMNGPESGYVHPNESPLSAAVPDFTPAPEAISTVYHDVEITFQDAEVEKLDLLYSQKGRDNVKDNSPAPGASSRTFSNGSIDGRSITEELKEMDTRQGRTLTNGGSGSPEFSPNSLRRSRSPFSLSPTKAAFGNGPPIMWVKGHKDQASLESEHAEPYLAVRARALRRRESAPTSGNDDDMRILFQFWSHFLVRNFNPRMYEEFRGYASEDAHQRQDLFGMTRLVTFYDEVLNSKKRTIPEIFAKHYIELVNGEDPSGPRLGFARLRAAWRNGALDMKSRKKIDNLVDSKLREELEK